MKILFIGDIVGRIGRRAVVDLVPKIVRKEGVDLVIANGENLAHGKGITESTAKEVLGAQIDVLTTGNHIWAKKEFNLVLNKYPVVRPANYPDAPGQGYLVLEVGTKKVLVINLLGRAFMRESLDCPFRKLDSILQENKGKYEFALVDFHSEASSEARAFGLYADGKVEAVFGTHRHIPTADAQILPKGTFYITDVGMVGAYPSVLGVEGKEIIKSYLSGMPFRHHIPEEGAVEFNAVILETSAKKFKQVREVLK